MSLLSPQGQGSSGLGLSHLPELAGDQGVSTLWKYLYFFDGSYLSHYPWKSTISFLSWPWRSWCHGGTSAAAPVPGGCLPQPAAGTAALEPLLMPWRAKPKHNACQALRSLSWISPSFSRLATNTTHLAFSHPKNEKRGKFPERKQQGSKDITQRMYQLCDFYVTTILGGFSSFLYRSNIFLCCCSYDWAALWNGSAGDQKKKKSL